jgi:protein-S-isoprenylcysteine O-methyltransferase Ste14
MLRSILNTDIRSWAFIVYFCFSLILICYADWFVRRRDVGAPRMRIHPVFYVALALAAAWCRAWVAVLVGLAVFLPSIWLHYRALRKGRSWEKRLSRDSGDRTVLIVPDLSRRLVGEDRVLLPQVCLDRLSDAEVDALLARQAARQSHWPLLSAFTISLFVLFFGFEAAPPSLAPLVAAASMLCFWALTVWAIRRLDAQADAKAIQATGDPATYIQAIVKADRLMQEIPPRHRMSTWWLFPASLESRIAAITAANPPARNSG